MNAPDTDAPDTDAADTDAPDTDAPDTDAVGGRSAQAGASRIAAIGESERLRGFAFAGIHVAPADDDDGARAAWRSLPPETGLVILTAAAREALADELYRPDERLWVVIPT